MSEKGGKTLLGEGLRCLRLLYYRIPFVRRKKIQMIIALHEKWIKEAEFYSMFNVGRVSEIYKHRAELLGVCLERFKDQQISA